MKKYIYTGLLVCALCAATSLTSAGEGGYTTTPSLRRMGYVIAELDTGRCAPGKLILNATLTGTIDENGTLTVKSFKMDPVSYEPDSYL